jgi:hypothetical protein
MIDGLNRPGPWKVDNVGVSAPQSTPLRIPLCQNRPLETTTPSDRAPETTGVEWVPYVLEEAEFHPCNLARWMSQ